MSYISVINDVLARLREDSVVNPTDTTYSTLIGKFVNDAKNQVENSFAWNSLNTSVTIPMVIGQVSYTITGSGTRFKVISVVNDTVNTYLRPAPSGWIASQNLIAAPTNSAPMYYCFNGVSGGDTKVDIFPAPSSTDSVVFNLYVPQAALSTGSTAILVPEEPIIAGAYARALAERGEDDGLSAGEAYALFKDILGDAIAIEANRHVENDAWEAV